MASQTPPCGGGAVLVGTGAALQHVPTASTVTCGQSEHCPVPYAPKPNPKLLRVSQTIEAVQVYRKAISYVKNRVSLSISQSLQSPTY